MATKSEKRKIRKAIDHILNEPSEVQEACVLLGSIVGVRFPAFEVLLDPEGLKRVTLQEISERGDRDFKYPDPEKE